MPNQAVEAAVIAPIRVSSKEHLYSNSVELLSAMASPARLQILQMISDNEMSVGKIGEQLGLSQSATSQHLSKLRTAHLVSTRREAQTLYYALISIAVVKVLQLLADIW